jgi:hypothetical protein
MRVVADAVDYKSGSSRLSSQRAAGESSCFSPSFCAVADLQVVDSKYEVQVR